MGHVLDESKLLQRYVVAIERIADTVEPAARLYVAVTRNALIQAKAAIPDKPEYAEMHAVLDSLIVDADKALR